VDLSPDELDAGGKVFFEDKRKKSAKEEAKILEMLVEHEEEREGSEESEEGEGSRESEDGEEQSGDEVREEEVDVDMIPTREKRGRETPDTNNVKRTRVDTPGKKELNNSTEKSGFVKASELKVQNTPNPSKTTPPHSAKPQSSSTKKTPLQATKTPTLAKTPQHTDNNETENIAQNLNKIFTKIGKKTEIGEIDSEDDVETFEAELEEEAIRAEAEMEAEVDMLEAQEEGDVDKNEAKEEEAEQVKKIESESDEDESEDQKVQKERVIQPFYIAIPSPSKKMAKARAAPTEEHVQTRRSTRNAHTPQPSRSAALAAASAPLTTPKRKRKNEIEQLTASIRKSSKNQEKVNVETGSEVRRSTRIKK